MSISSVLQDVKGSGTFYIQGVLETINPVLDADGVGLVGIPVSTVQAQQLIAQADQAPFGRKEQTLVDKAVRNAWQLNPTQFRFRNPAFEQAIVKLLPEIGTRLGVARGEITAYLYKLLVYEAGGFFVSHRDTEKVPGMFATLILVLPSEYAGGALVISHDGKEIRFAQGDDQSTFLTRYCAFYADCLHTLEPVTKGHRVCLAYNLALSAKKQPSAPHYRGLLPELVREIDLFCQSSDDAVHAVLLDHQYTEANFHPHALKNGDIVKAELLADAARAAGYDAHLALISCVEYWSAQVWEDGEYSRNKRKGVEYELFDMGDSTITANRFFTSEGTPLTLDKLELGSDQIDPPDPFDPKNPDDENVTEATGNEGATAELWYHRAGVLFWRPEDWVIILCDIGVRDALNYAENLVSQWEISAKAPDSALFAKCFDAVKTIAQHSRFSEQEVNANLSPAALLRLARRLDRWDVLDPVIGAGLATGNLAGVREELAASAHAFGWTAIIASLRQSLSSIASSRILQWGEMVAQLTISENALDDCHSEAQLLCQELYKAATLFMEKSLLDKSWNRKRSFAGEWTMLLKTQFRFRCVSLLQSSLQTLMPTLTDAELYTIAIPVLQNVTTEEKRNPELLLNFMQLYEFCYGRLTRWTADAPLEPTSWSEPVKISCKCADCRELENFSAHPLEIVHRFKMGQERRKHLEAAIITYTLSMSCATEKTGSPLTLVCTKDRRKYDAALKKYKLDQKLLEQDLKAMVR